MSIKFAKSIVFDVDAYKVSMWKQYPPETKYVYSYIEARTPKEVETLYFGLQAFIIDVLSKQVTQEEVDLGDKFWTAVGEPFNKDGWQYILDMHNGFLPLKIMGLDEGLLVPSQTPLVTVVNTDPECFWLTTWVETALLRAIWYPTTVATKSYDNKQLILSYLEKSGDSSGIGFALNDFGSRGVSSNESACLGGMAHLVNFMGSDTSIANLAASEFYGADAYATSYSIPASEHSTITSWGRGNESLAYTNMVKQFSKPGSIYAAVSDSYDIFNAVENIWGKELKELVISSGGTLVIRPDSGDPLEVIPRLLHSLADNFGYTTNSKGYKVLNNVKLIWGDGINKQTISSILRVVVDVMGFSANNIAFGQGGALLQMVNRDDYKFAMKCSSIDLIEDGKLVERNVFKDPVTDHGKKSKAGKFTVDFDFNVNSYSIVESELYQSDSMLKLRFYNGTPINMIDFATVRANSLK